MGTINTSESGRPPEALLQELEVTPGTTKHEEAILIKMQSKVLAEYSQTCLNQIQFGQSSARALVPTAAS